MSELSAIEAIEKLFSDFNIRFATRERYEEIKEHILKKPNDYQNDFFRLLDEIVLDEDSQFYFYLQPGMELYWARIIDQKDYPNYVSGNPAESNGIGIDIIDGKYITTGFDEKNSIESPIGVPSAGRNNVQGMSYLYLAEDIATACAEVKSLVRQLVSLATFQVKKPICLIDFSKEKLFDKQFNTEHDINLAVFFTMVMMQFSIPTNGDDYRITQIISDYIRKAGIDGVAYRSFKTGKNNYTLFNSHKSKIEFLNTGRSYPEPAPEGADHAFL